jgi:hypothetical protein
MQAKLQAAADAGDVIALWKTDGLGLPVYGSKQVPQAQPGRIHTERGPIKLCNPGTLHASLEPAQWKGARCWVVALRGPVEVGNAQFGALEREVIAEFLPKAA